MFTSPSGNLFSSAVPCHLVGAALIQADHALWHRGVQLFLMGVCWFRQAQKCPWPPCSGSVESGYICSLKPGYSAGSWEAWTFPAEWRETREPSLATSPIEWQEFIKHGASGRKLSLKKASVIRLQKWQGLKDTALVFISHRPPPQAVAIPEDHGSCPSIWLVSLLSVHLLQGYKNFRKGSLCKPLRVGCLS